MAVIRPEIETDPAALELIAIEYLQEAIPGWEPADGDLMTWLIGAHARMVAEERDIAADVPLEQILRPLGEEVHRIPPRVATPATVEATVTVRDEKGYTVPEGMEVLVLTSGDDGVTMVVTDPVTVPPSDPEAPELEVDVMLRAAPGREGAAANGLDSTCHVVPIRPLEFVESIVLSGVSGGGADAETDEQYLERLVDTLALTSPVPILVEDFAALARQQPGVERAMAFNRRLRQAEVIKLEAQGPTVGLEITDAANDETIVLTANATSEAVRTAFSAYEATVTGGRLGEAPLTVELNARTRYGPWRVRAVNGWGSVEVLQQGVDRVDVDRAVTVAVVGPGGEEATPEALTRVRDALEAVRELNWRVAVTRPTPNTIDVSFTAVAWPSYDPSAVAEAARAALGAYLSAANWGSGEARGEEAATDWVEDRVVRYLEVAQVLNAVPGLRYVTRLEVWRHGTTHVPGADVPITGEAPVPVAGEITAIVRGG